MRKSIGFLVSVLLLAASHPAAEAAEKYSGDWLASELGLNSPNAAEQAINKLKHSKAASPQELRAAVEPNLVSESQTLYQLVGSQQNENALALAQKLIDEVLGKLEKSNDDREKQLLVQFLFQVYQNKIRALYQNKQAFEALFHGLKMRSLCNKHGCSADQLQSLQTTMSYIEQAIQTVRAADALGLESSELGNQSKVRAKRRRLMSLLHPDKNMDLDEATRKELGSIFDLANKTYEQLLAESRN